MQLGAVLGFAVHEHVAAAQRAGLRALPKALGAAAQHLAHDTHLDLASVEPARRQQPVVRDEMCLDHAAEGGRVEAAQRVDGLAS